MRSLRKVLILAAAAMVLGAVIWAVGRQDKRPCFQDISVELGTEKLTARDFLVDRALSGRIGFVSDPSVIDLGTVGTTAVTLSRGRTQETVTLTVADTTPPALEVLPSLGTDLYALPEAEDLVTHLSDLSAVKVFYDREPVVPLDYRDTTVTVVAEDAWGNRTEKDCVLSFRWMREAVTLELGEALTKEIVLYNPERDGSFIDQLELNKIKASGVGSYTVSGQFNGCTQSCRVTVADTQGPELELKDIQQYYVPALTAEDFVVSVSDASGSVTLELLSDLKVSGYGKFPAVIRATDHYGNQTTKEATFWVAADFFPPVIEGSMEPLVLNKGQQLPDLLEGITATDKVDGVVAVTCSTGDLDPSVGGEYTITYTATDSSGNTAEACRKVTVPHDAEDTQALVLAVAQQLSDDPAQIRKYVQWGIAYNHDWGGEDPVWYGFTQKRGNCYVHAHCMKAILDAKGIENQLIWVENESHYWLLVKVDNQWKHMDPTPTRVALPDYMNDIQRLQTLSGRRWDTGRWPASR